RVLGRGGLDRGLALGTQPLPLGRDAREYLFLLGDALLGRLKLFHQLELARFQAVDARREHLDLALERTGVARDSGLREPLGIALLAGLCDLDVALDALELGLDVVARVGALDESPALIVARCDELFHTSRVRRILPLRVDALQRHINRRKIEQNALVSRRCLHVGPAGIEPTTTWV